MKKPTLSSLTSMALLAAVSLASHSVSASIIENTINTAGLSEPIAIAYGDHTSNSAISPGVDIDGYTFQGSAGDALRFVVASHSYYFDPLIELRNPIGTVVHTQSCSGSSGPCVTFFDQVLSSNGKYFLNISDVGNNETGSYTLDLEQFPPTNNWYGLAYDSPVTTQLGHAGDHDFLAFEGAAATSVRVNVEGNSYYLDPQLQIWDPLGNLIVDNFCNGSSGACSFSTELDLTLSGIYKMALFDAGFNETGSYSLNVGCVFGSCPSAAPNPVPVPAAVWLFISGFACLTVMGRYKKQLI